MKKMINIIISIFVFCLLSKQTGLAKEDMDIESFIRADLKGELVLNLEINTGKNRENFLNEKIKNADPKKLLSLLSNYDKDASYSTRRLALLYEVKIANLHPSTKIRQEVVNNLVEVLIEPNSNVFENSYTWLTTFKKNDFNNNTKKLLHDALSKNNPSSRVILICGVAEMKEELSRLKELTIDEIDYQKDPKNTLKWYFTTGWAARLARARMGVKEDIAKCIEVSESVEEPNERVDEVLPHIGYIRQPEAIEYLKKYLYSDKKLPSQETYGNWVLHILTITLSNFPVKQNETRSYTNEEIALSRKWMSEQKTWQILR